jgi:hypothetical protein
MWSQRVALSVRGTTERFGGTMYIWTGRWKRLNIITKAPPLPLSDCTLQCGKSGAGPFGKVEVGNCGTSFLPFEHEYMRVICLQTRMNPPRNAVSVCGRGNVSCSAASCDHWWHPSLPADLGQGYPKVWQVTTPYACNVPLHWNKICLCTYIACVANTLHSTLARSLAFTAVKIHTVISWVITACNLLRGY